MNSSVSADDWMKLFASHLENGQELRLAPWGSSMYPFLVSKRDQVILQKPTKELQKGDICLYRRDDGLHVLHRIVRIDLSGIYMIGDAQTTIEGPLRQNQMIAVVSTIIRKDKMISVQNRRYQLLWKIWLAIIPFRPIILGAWKVVRVVTLQQLRDRKKYYEYCKKEQSKEQFR